MYTLTELIAVFVRLRENTKRGRQTEHDLPIIHYPQQRVPEKGLPPYTTPELLLGDQQIRLVVLVHFQCLPL